MSKEYIVKNKAIEICGEWYPEDDGSVGRTGDLRDMLDEIENLPEEMVVPIAYAVNIRQI